MGQDHDRLPSKRRAHPVLQPPLPIVGGSPLVRSFTPPNPNPKPSQRHARQIDTFDVCETTHGIKHGTPFGDFFFIFSRAARGFLYFAPLPPPTALQKDADQGIQSPSPICVPNTLRPAVRNVYLHVPAVRRVVRHLRREMLSETHLLRVHADLWSRQQTRGVRTGATSINHHTKHAEHVRGASDAVGNLSHGFIFCRRLRFEILTLNITIT